MPNGKVIWKVPVITDNWGATHVTQVSNYQPGDVFPIGISTVTYTATDCSGNEQTFSLSITINGIIENCYY